MLQTLSPTPKQASPFTLNSRTATVITTIANASQECIAGSTVAIAMLLWTQEAATTLAHSNAMMAVLNAVTMDPELVVKILLTSLHVVVRVVEGDHPKHWKH